MSKSIAEYLKNYNKKVIDIYDLAYVYNNKPLLLWTKEQADHFVSELNNLEAQEIIVLKRGSKGESKLDMIQRKIVINKWKLIGDFYGIDDIIFNQDLGIDASYYLKNNGEYIRDRVYIERLSEFLMSNNGELTLNEIGYLVFNDEKALTQPDKAAIDGKRIFANLKLDIGRIPHIETISPFYFPTSESGDTILIVENKDTCFSLFRILDGTNTNIKGILYGEGRAVLKIFSFLHIYGLDNKYDYLYYGDIDQEGIDIFRTLIEKFNTYYIKLSGLLYHNLLQHKSQPLRSKRNINFSNIEETIKDLCYNDKKAVMKVLEQDKYIPQEALNYLQMKEVIDGVQNRLY